MNALYFDSNIDDEGRRKQIYQGHVFLYSPRPAALALCAFARELTEAAFGSLDPRTAQHELPGNTLRGCTG